MLWAALLSDFDVLIHRTLTLAWVNLRHYVLILVVQVSFAITTAAIEAAKAAAGGSRGKGSPRKRARTENGAASSSPGADDTAVAKKLFVEQPSPITAAKAIKNQVGTNFHIG